MNTEQLRYFLSIARHRSFTEAAREFYVTQPTITHQIAALERELGVRLFLRTTRSVSLTRAGELFLGSAKQMLELDSQARERLRQLSSGAQQALKIGYLNSATRHFLPQIIAEYRQRHPQVRIDLVQRDAAGLQEGTAEECFDLVFSVLSDLEGMSGYTTRKLTSDFYCIVCPKHHPCLSDTQLDYEKLAAEHFACMSRTSGALMHKQFLQICRSLGFSPTSVTEYPAMEDVLFAVECAQAIAILPYHVRTYMHTNLAFIPLDIDTPAIHLGLAWRTPTDNPCIHWFLDLINHFLVEHPQLF